MFLINNLTVVIVTYKTNDQILEECIESILGIAKILIIVAHTDDEAFGLGGTIAKHYKDKDK